MKTDYFYKYNKRIKKIKTLVRATFSNLKENGIRVTAGKIARRLGVGTISYWKWMKIPLYPEHILEEQRRQTFDKQVMFSIITPIYNTPERFLREMIDSVLAQTYSNWELCMADGSDETHGYVQEICRAYAKRDLRIKYRKLEKNLGIAGNSNACIEMAKGDYISILDHDDLLHPAALHDVMETVCRDDADFIYTDELTFESPDPKDVVNIHFKPDYAPDNLRANNYICHFTSIKRSLLDLCGYFREGFDGSQDHELFLRLTDQAQKIVHIPKELYYWRAYESSTAFSETEKPYAALSGMKAVASFLGSKKINASVTLAIENKTIYRVSYELPATEPLISIIIPNYEHIEDLQLCIQSIQNKTTYQNYEIIIVENNSQSPELFRYYKELTEHYSNIKVLYWQGTGFNWSALNNFGVQEAAGEYVLLINNDTEVISSNWIQEMLMYAQRPDVGIVGAMLYYPDDKVQHAGVLIGKEIIATHAFSETSRGEYGYMKKLSYAQDVSAVTGACMLMRKKVFEKTGGMDEQFAVGLNDIDFCMRVRRAGYLVVWTPYAELYHYESRSRGLA